MKIKVKFAELRACVDIPSPELPKYTKDLMNNANRYSQATWPKNVGQMTELIQEFPGQTLEEWIAWYQERYPHAIENATDKIVSMIENITTASLQIDRMSIKSWVEDLILVKTFAGLKIQEAILRKLSEIKGSDYRLANPSEESQGIDGFVGEEAYSIKPTTYKTMQHLAESIEVKKIFYEKNEDGVWEFELPEE